MSRQHSSLIVRDPLVSSHTQSHGGGVNSARDPNSLAAVVEDCGGTLWALRRTSSILRSVMYLATIVALYRVVPDLSMSLFGKAAMIACVLIGLIPVVFFTPVVSISFGALCSAAGFLGVAIFLPMEQDMKWLYGIGVVLLLATSEWASQMETPFSSQWWQEVLS